MVRSHVESADLVYAASILCPYDAHPMSALVWAHAVHRFHTRVARRAKRDLENGKTGASVGGRRT